MQRCRDSAAPLEQQDLQQDLPAATLYTPLSVSHVNTAFIALTQREDGEGTPTLVSSPQKKEVNFLPKPDIAGGERDKQTNESTVTHRCQRRLGKSGKDKTNHRKVKTAG